MKRSLKLVPEGVCPTCGQRLPPVAKRCCSECKGPILKGHKFVFVGSTVRHRHCSQPDSYILKQEGS